MKKKYEVTITSDKNNKLRLDRANFGFNGLELLGLLEILREDIMKQMKGEQLEAEKEALIDKACEWLKDNYPYYFETDIEERFVKAMKGGDNESEITETSEKEG